MKLEKEIARWWMMPTQDRIPPSSSWKFDRYGRDFWSTDHVLLYWNLGRCGPLGHSNKRSVIFFGFVLYSRPRGASSSREESPSPFFSNRVGNWGMIVYDAIGAISLPPHLSLGRLMPSSSLEVASTKLANAFKLEFGRLKVDVKWANWKLFGAIREGKTWMVDSGATWKTTTVERPKREGDVSFPPTSCRDRVASW